MSIQEQQPLNKAPAVVEPCPAVKLLIEARIKDLGGFAVRRLLPHAKQRLVGPFIFFDHMGPAQFAPGQGVDVRPHPHINLSTVTYLFEGAFMHRDSLGSAQLIEPGAVNWMTAGRGIVHSERTPPELRKGQHRVHGLQLWVALPHLYEEISPVFEHCPAAALPSLERNGARIRVLAGRAYGVSSPVRTHSPLVYLDVELEQGRCLRLPDDYSERAIYTVDGELRLGQQTLAQHQMMVLNPGPVEIQALNNARAVMIGGEPLDGERYIWWNFVSSRKERIEQAQADWKENRFAPVPGETEFIPLPQ
ncbi:MAG TPA: pirin family protein [Gammaproteobacteria bacterium]